MSVFLPKLSGMPIASLLLRVLLLSPLASLALPFFSTLFYKTKLFGGKKLWNVYFHFPYNFYLKIFSFWKGFSDILSQMYIGLVQILMSLEDSWKIFKNLHIQNFMKIRSVWVELFLADRQTDGQREMTKLKVTFRNFANASEVGNSFVSGVEYY